jgi:hypothetical protein
LQRTSGEGEPPAKRFGQLRVGRQRRQILRPQREKAPRQIVFLAHRRHYRAWRRSSQHAFERDVVFDEADRANRCIVA